MKTLKKWGQALLLTVVALVAAVLTGLSDLFGRPRVAVANSAASVGTHENGVVTRELEAALATRYLLVKTGSSAGTEVLVNTDGDQPLGVVPDEGAIGDKCAVQLLGAVQGTVKMVASEAITAEEEVYTDDDGKVQDLPSTAGTYYKVGLALTAGGADEVIEVLPCYPVAVTVE